MAVHWLGPALVGRNMVQGLGVRASTSFREFKGTSVQVKVGKVVRISGLGSTIRGLS
jgi:hypothetical protein